MLETFIKARFLDKLRSGPAGPYVDGFAKYLYEASYNHWSGRNFLYAAAHLVGWTQRKGVAITKLDEDRLERFRKHVRRCRCPRPNGGKGRDAMVGCRLFLNYLRQNGEVADTFPERKGPAYPCLVNSFRHWMKQHRGVGESILDLYSRYISEMLQVCGQDPKRFDAKGLRAFVFERARSCSRGTAKLIVTALRMFLRYLISKGKCEPGLEHALPTLAHWRLSTLPRYLSGADVERVIAACDGQTPLGARDRAIILLLARLGLRAGDVAGLRLGDVDWRDASLCVSGKGRREDRLPLSQELGDAILHYLKHRPPINFEQVFVCACAPLRPLKPLTVTQIVGRVLRRAGVEAPCYGAHVLRHSAATQMLRQGVSLQDIQALLRHSSIQTTEWYAKVDLALLKPIAQPWPEVSSC